MISHWDKFVTFGQIPVEADVISAVNSVIGLALAMDSGLTRIIREKMYI